MVVGIVGLGLIGGSMAKAVSEHTGHKVLGADLDPAVLAGALSDGAIIGELTDSRLALCEFIVVALTPVLTENWFSEKGALVAKETVVVDCCGTKRAVCAAGRAAASKYGFTFVGGHPMAGIEKMGYGASRADLFKGASMILVEPGDKEEMLAGFFQAVGFGGGRHGDGRSPRRCHRLHLAAGPRRVECLHHEPHGRAAGWVFGRQLQGYDTGGLPQRGAVGRAVLAKSRQSGP